MIILIMIQQFIDRKDELKSLNDFYERKGSQFIVIYGRRRVGKTELIKEFVKNREHIYFLADDRKDEFNIRELQLKMAELLNDTLFAKAEIKDWVELFKEFSKRNKKKIILAIDEFPYLIKANKSIPSVFQKIWDEILSKTSIYLILCGSSISMMEKEVLMKESPLYGRRTGQWLIEPIKFRYLHEFFPKYSMLDLIEAYSVLDGIPLYLLKFDSDDNVSKNIIARILKKGEFLYQEAEFLLKEELREPGNYFMILKAISFGKTKSGEIVDYTGLDKTLVSKYLDTLFKLHIVKKIYPVTSREKIRDTRYVFEDNYFKFWLRFVYPNKSAIEEGKMVLNKQEFNQYVSFVFEEVCRQYVSEKLKYGKAGSWWHKEQEIDIVATGEKTLFAECKWKENVDGEKVLKELKEKSKLVKYKTAEYFVFAKSFKKKTKEMVDLKDLEKLFKKN